jgi:protein-S-isoprenylcysteine O-methyltransferase Ste14
MITDQYQKVGTITILSGTIALLSYTLAGAAINFRFEAFSVLSLILKMDDIHVPMLRWSMITDIFGYYLLLLPLLFFIHAKIKDRSSWSQIYTYCGGGYILMGSTGAAILSVVWPWCIMQYQITDTQGQQIMEYVFGAVSHLVSGGMWNQLDALLMSLWLIGLSSTFRSSDSLTAGFTFFTGLCSLGDFLGGMLQISTLAYTGLNLYLVLAPIWAIYIGIKVRKNQLFI